MSATLWHNKVVFLLFFNPFLYCEDIHDNLANSENYLQLKLVVLGKQVNVELRRGRHKKKTDGKKKTVFTLDWLTLSTFKKRVVYTIEQTVHYARIPNQKRQENSKVKACPACMEWASYSRSICPEKIVCIVP